MNRIARCAAVVAAVLFSVAAHAALTVTPITWNIIGLDSNDPLTGPNTFPVGARVCSDVAVTNVSATFVWDSANANINLRSGTSATIVLPALSAGGCADAYFEVEVTRTAAAFDTARRYHITATDGVSTASTPVPRELYVERLISQNRNSISDVRFGTSLASLTSVPPGGTLDLVVGNTYFIQVVGGTATQGYNQFEEFMNLSNTIFQILAVNTTYSADNSPYVPNPNDKLYADACLWDNDPNSPTYRACVGGDFKAGGNTVVTTYTVRIISGGGTSQTLSTLLYDFSGSSFHYNADYSTGARIAAISDPNLATIAKNFNPDPTPLNGVSTLTITLGNPNPGALGGYTFVDNLPANLVVAATPNATASGCGTPTLTATAGSSTISFSNGTVGAGSTCVITVNVTPTATGTLTNTTGPLSVAGVNTGKTATDTITVSSAPPPPPGICGTTAAAWTFPAGFSATSPAPTTDNANGTPSAAPGDGVNATSFTEGTNSWGSNGSITTGATLVTANEDYLEFAVDPTGYTNLQLTFAAARKNNPNSPQGVAVYAGSSSLPRDAVAGNGTETGTAVFGPTATALPTGTTAFTTIGPLTLPAGTTHVRIYFFNSGNQNPGSDAFVDNVTFSGCVTAVQPTLSKSFSPDPIAVGGTSTLTFTLANTNPGALTGAAFTDALPAGVQVAATPSAASTCGGTWAPAAGATTLTFSGGTVPASSSCTVSVNVTATTAGAHTNVSGYLSTTESGTSSTAFARDVLTAVAPPAISKNFDPSPILPNGVSTLTFIIENPNSDFVQSGVAFSDTFPAGMVLATVPNATTSGCGAPVFSPAASASSVAFSGGTIAAGGTCVVTVDVTAASVGTYNNTSGSVSHVVNAQTVNGNTASDSLVVEAPAPAIGLRKEVGPTASGPWAPFHPTTAGSQVFYRFTIENTGDVALTNPQITDNTLNVSSCNATLSGSTLPAPVAANENHIVQCVVGPITAVTGSNVNTASVSASFGATPVSSTQETATYATTGLTLDKSASPATFTAPGNVVNYSYLVTNSGFAPLEGPVTVTDNRTTVTCPAVTTVGDLDNFLDPGESITCTATYTITAADVAATFVTNTATASADGVSSNSDSATVTLAGITAADMSVVKTLVTTGTFRAGQSIQYTLVVTNGGPSTATNVQVTDTPTNLTLTAVSGGGCTAFPCSLGTMTSGSSVTINVTATIVAAGAFDNAATVSATETDPNPANNTDNTGNGGTAVPTADMSVVKTLVTTGTYRAGQSIQYTLVVTNGGPSTATNVQVTDTPTNLTITAVSGGGCTAFPCSLGTMTSGSSVTINVTATIVAAGAFDNAATVSATETDPNPANNTDNTGNGGTAVPAADMSVVKTLVTTGTFRAGQSIQYTLVVTNGGPSTATNVQVTDTPTNLTITAVSGGGCTAFPCSLGTMTSGSSVTINVTATIVAAGAFDNAATVSATETDPNPANNTDNTGNGGTAAPAADVSVVKTLVTAGPYSAGQSISYTLVVTNGGPSTATTVQVTDTPANLTITGVSGACTALPCTIASLASGISATINVTATINAVGAFDNAATVSAAEVDPNLANNTDNTDNGSITGPSADVSMVKTLTTAGPFAPGQTVNFTLVVANAGPSTATTVQVTDTPSNLTITSVSGGGCIALPCTIASIASGASVTINVAATIDAAGAFDNSATALAAEPDPNLGNNTDPSGNGGIASTVPTADMRITKSGPNRVISAGQTFDYTLAVVNAGPSAATNVVVTDPLPGGFSLLSATSTQGTCSGTTTVTCNVGAMPVNATVTITIRGTVTQEGTLTNTATVTATETDPVPGNNTSTISIATAAGIPTLSEWALIALALMLGAAGVLLRR